MTKPKVPPALRALRKFTIEQAAAALAVHPVTAGQHLKKLHAHGRVHIYDFAPDTKGRKNVIVFRVGKGVDAQRSPVSSAERARRHRQRKKETT